MCGEDSLHGIEREIRKVLVVYLIELISVDCAEEMRKLDRHHSGRLQQNLQACDEIINVRHLCQHVVAENQVRSLAVGEQLPSRLNAKKFNEGRYTFLARNLCDVGSRLDSECRNASVDEVLK